LTDQPDQLDPPETIAGQVAPAELTHVAPAPSDGAIELPGTSVGGQPAGEQESTPASGPESELAAEAAPAAGAPVASSVDESAARATSEPIASEPDTAEPDSSEPAHPGPQLVLTSKPLPPPKAVDQKSADKAAAKQKLRDEEAEQSPFSVLVGQVYDGPLDLLLDLIRKQDIDIYDIPIARITAQFLAYVNQLKSGDMDVAGEFIYTASLLIHIKSKMLLPRAASGPEDAAEDPRRELVERLLEHERFKNARGRQLVQSRRARVRGRRRGRAGDRRRHGGSGAHLPRDSGARPQAPGLQRR
jgi:hypothetical protein